MKVTERGWPAHYICAHRCLFRRNTLIEHNGRRVVVSTVGAQRENDKIEKIGLVHYYETMVFHAELVEGYWEADTTRMLRIKSKDRVTRCCGSADQEANDMHEAVVKEFKTKIKKWKRLRHELQAESERGKTVK